MSQQRISAQILNELNQFCAGIYLFNKALDHDNFDAAKKIELQLRTRHFNETGSWIVGIKKLVEGLEKGSKPVGILQQPFEPPQINNNNFNTLANGTSSSTLRPRAGSNPQNIGRPSSFVAPPGNQVTFVPPPVLTNTNQQPHSLIVNQPVGPPPIPNMSAIRPPASSQQHPNASTATPISSAPPALTVTTRPPNSYAQSSNSFQQIGSASIMSPNVMPNMKALNLNGFPTNLATQQSFSQTSLNAQPPPAGIAFGAPPIPYNSSANASNAPQFSFGVPQSTPAPGPPPTFNYGAPTQTPWIGNRPGFQSQPTPQNPSRPPTSGPYGY
jgi:protein transport protein SEC31